MRLILCAAVCMLAAGAKKPQPIVEGLAGNSDVTVKATLYADPETVKGVIGSDLDGHYIVVRVELTPTTKYKIDQDDFLLKTDKDGERSHPFKPTQIAGDGALIVSDNAIGGGGTKQGNPRGPVWGGSSGGVGNTPTQMGSKATMQQATGTKNPVLDSLNAKMLPEKSIDQPTSGLLYFPMEKQKVKDLELFVTTPTGKLEIRFSK